MARLIFCESHGYWAAKFRQICPPADFPVEETRLLSDLQRSLREAPGSLLAIAVRPAQIVEIAALLDALRDPLSLERGVALLDRTSRNCHTALRGLGFIDVISAPLELIRLHRLTRRHLSLLPEQQLTWREAILARLPWQPPDLVNPQA
jgi:hypothetical protein